MDDDLMESKINDMDRKIQDLEILCQLSQIEIIHLKKLLVAKEVIEKDKIDGYRKYLDKYLQEIEMKKKNYIRMFCSR
ncbi:MAG: hypothetical protein NT047_07515 [Deltaproteobacteria bacterium]|nr:hypothetical protein [Deltaproteobacteria bacterium]